MSQKIQIPVINKSPHELPAYQTAAAAGLDLRAWLQENIILQPLQRALIPTGLHLEIPEGFEAQVRPRSGLAYKFGVTVLNSPGTIDADYRGEIKVLLVNLSNEPYVVQNGERIAQLVLAAHAQVNWHTAVTLTESTRGTKGFGSSGSN